MHKQLAATILCLMLSSSPLWGQSWENQGAGEVKAGLGFEYFQRNVSLNKDSDMSAQMSGLLFNLGADYQIQDYISVGVFAGYALSAFDQVIFRELPFSLQIDEEQVNGIIAGARFTAGSLYVSSFEIKGTGQFVYCVGMEQDWNIPGLVETGTATGKSDWMRVAAGPVIYYGKPLIINPYAAIQFNYLWGTFSMDEEIGNLSGTEEKEIRAKGYVSISGGGVTQLTPSLELIGRIDLMPDEEGVDFGIMISIAYIF